MSLKLSWISTVVSFACLVAPTVAEAVIVPVDYPTIQAALDAGETTIQVGNGVTPEPILVAHNVAIQPLTDSGSVLGGIWESTPVIASLRLVGVTYSTRLQLSFHGVRFLGSVEVPLFVGSLVFESCRFDSGLVGPNTTNPSIVASIRGCTFFGDVSVHCPYAQFIRNTVIGGKAYIWSDGLHDIEHNFVRGPADAGLEISTRDSDGPISWNTVREVGDGIRYLGDCSQITLISGNDIADCSDDGITYRGATDRVTARCDSNLIQRCGASGIAVRGTLDPDRISAHLIGNVILNSGQDGVHFDVGRVDEARDNVILDSGGAGFVATSAGYFTQNVIGRSSGDGTQMAIGDGSLGQNTFFLNRGAGVHAGHASMALHMSRNILASNTGPGLRIDSIDHGPVDLACNDYFGNGGGATMGIEPAATDLFVNPLFCDLTNGDVHLAANSPLLNAGDCGQIGALGQGCGIIGIASPPVSLPNEEFTAWPLPALRKVSFSLLPSREPTVLEVFDVTGARRWQTTLPARATRAEWDRRETDGGLALPGVYFARLRRGDVEVARTRIVLMK